MADNTTNVKVTVTADDSSDKAIADAVQRVGTQFSKNLTSAVTRSIRESMTAATQAAERTGQRVRMGVNIPVHEGDEQVGTMSTSVTGRSRAHQAADAARVRAAGSKWAHTARTAHDTGRARAMSRHARVVGDPVASPSSRERAEAELRSLAAEDRAESHEARGASAHARKIRKRRAALADTGRSDYLTDFALNRAARAGSPRERRETDEVTGDMLETAQRSQQRTLRGAKRDRVMMSEAGLQSRLAELSATAGLYSAGDSGLFRHGPGLSQLQGIVGKIGGARSEKERAAFKVTATQAVREAESESRVFLRGVGRTGSVRDAVATLDAMAGRIDAKLFGGLKTKLLQVEANIGKLSPHEAGGQQGKDLKDEAAGIVKTARGQQTSASSRRGLFGGAGTIMAGRRLGQGVDQMAGALFGDRASAIPGQALTTAGGVMQDLGFARIAAGASGGAALAGVGLAVAAAGAIVTAGVKRGYERSEMADDLYGKAEPFFERAALEQRVAHRGTGAERRRRIDERGGYAQDYSGMAGMVLTPMLGVNGRSDPDVRRQLHERLSDHKAAETRADAELKTLHRIGFVEPDIRKRLQMVMDFRNQSGVGGAGTASTVTDIRTAALTGLDRGTAAATRRLEFLTGQHDINNQNQLGAAFTARGIVGRPRDEAIKGVIDRGMAARSAGFSPDMQRATAFVRTYLDEGGTDVDVSRVAGMASGMRASAYDTFAAPGLGMAKGLMVANAFKGRDYWEAQEYMATTDETTQLAESLFARGESPDSDVARHVAAALDPRKGSEVLKTLERLHRGESPDPDLASAAIGAFMRREVTGVREDNLIGQQRDIADVARIEDFKASLDSLAVAARRVTDTVGSAFAGIF